MTYFTEYFLNNIWTFQDNIVFSPFSLHSATAIATLGATFNSVTQLELLSLYGTSFEDIFALRDSYTKMIQDLSNFPETLSFANGIWANQKIFRAMKIPFKRTVEDDFGGKVDDLERKRPQNEINQFLKDKTKGKVSNIWKRIDSDLIIVNAGFYKAAWIEKFEPFGSLFFTKSDGKKVKTRFMIRESEENKLFFYNFPLLRTEGVANLTCLTIPYENDRFEMIILMPQDPNHLNRINNQLHERTAFDQDKKSLFLSEIFNKVDRNSFDNFEVIMPEFKIDYEVEAQKVFRQMGAIQAFENGAELKGISENTQVKIDKIMHKASIEVTENGTEGTASTSFTTRSESLSPPRVIIDKPFMFFVRDHETGVVLLAGKYTDPQ